MIMMMALLRITAFILVVIKMKKLKIRQYWTEFGRPWYVIRYGHKGCDYITASGKNVELAVSTAIERGERIRSWDSEPLVYQ